ncbi:DUF1707 domain-containing protein [Tenggerimyces flavus]|uniref:DUF1707 domain-containing protein n=1 Tax=Tenggerimyces flavus TaxID=1708749 RepID=A0ABV7YAI2_9ACTN|nr:DUF1707 domain-containing protein [Tenggerimyces flavus]MBM7785118.1 hypothetical protein [Tenggerimyces flavus]
MPEDRPQRITQHERDQTVRRLQEAYASGELSHDELDDRLQQALTATTSSELAPILASLPEIAPDRTVRISAKAGRIQRRGTWQVPKTFEIESEFGKVDLDLSRAIIEHPAIQLELKLRFGKARITVPRNAVVELDDLRCEWKQPVDRPPVDRPTNGVRIRISGEMEFGRLVVRYARH